MTDSIPDLIAEAQAMATRYIVAGGKWNYEHGELFRKLADALESLSAPPATMTVDEAWQEHLNEHGYATVPVSAGTGADFYAGWEKREAAFRRPAPPASTDKQDDALIQAISHADTEAFISIADTNILTDAILAAGYRRVSPLTREAVEAVIEEAEGRYDGMSAIGKPPGSVVPSFERFLAEAIMSSLSVPEPAEVEWETRRVRHDGTPVPEWEGSPIIDLGWRTEHRTKAVPAGPWVPVEKGAEQ